VLAAYLADEDGAAHADGDAAAGGGGGEHQASLPDDAAAHQDEDDGELEHVGADGDGELEHEDDLAAGSGEDDPAASDEPPQPVAERQDGEHHAAAHEDDQDEDHGDAHEHAAAVGDRRRFPWTDAQRRHAALFFGGPAGGGEVLPDDAAAQGEDEHDGELERGEDAMQPVAAVAAALPERHLRALIHGEWLSDEVINAWGQLVRGLPPPRQPRRQLVVTTFLYTMLRTDSRRVRRWFTETALQRQNYPGQASIFAFETVLVPVHMREGSHWGLAVIDVGARRIQFYNSLRGDDDEDGVVLRVLAAWLEEEETRCTGQPAPHGAWQQEPTAAVTPRQTNGHDCGVFVCAALEALSQGGAPSLQQEDMPAYRLRMARRLGAEERLLGAEEETEPEEEEGAATAAEAAEAAEAELAAGQAAAMQAVHLAQLLPVLEEGFDTRRRAVEAAADFANVTDAMDANNETVAVAAARREEAAAIAAHEVVAPGVDIVRGAVQLVEADHQRAEDFALR